MGRVLGVDLGERRVGLALTDPGRTFASPLDTIPFVSERKIAERLADLCRQHDADLVVVGLPVRDDGAERENCARARRIVDRLVSLGVRAESWDESWSSRDAAEALREAGGRRASVRRRIDPVAAALVLRDWMEHRRA
ncbi:MAG: Holliday junction resolvase RuvX [Spirochaetes bacterium]|nr:Holliday junction resolvase RuvX [Spirochaetota bacterium]